MPVAGLVLLLAICCLAPQTALSAECGYLKANIKKERDLVKRRALQRQAVEQCPNDAGLRYSYGFSLERLRKHDEALNQYSLALKLDPNMSKAHFSMGDIYRSQGKIDEAIAAYQAGLKVDPDNSRAIKSLNKLLEEAKNN